MKPAVVKRRRNRSVANVARAASRWRGYAFGALSGGLIHLQKADDVARQHCADAILIFESNGSGVVKVGKTLGKTGSSVIKADGYDILKDPTREQARSLLVKSKHGSLRGLRDSEGSLFIWDAFDAYHGLAAKEVGEFGNDFERLLFNKDQLDRFPQGVFFGEEGYGRTYVGREDAISVHEAKLSPTEFDKAFK